MWEMTEADKKFKLLKQYSDIFSTNNDLGCTKKLNHSIHTGDSQSGHQQPRKNGTFTEAETKRIITGNASR